MLKISRTFILISSALLSVACATLNDENNNMKHEPGALDVILCEEPRSQICTREYDPVCAKLQDGHVKTYATGCTSCADPQVKSYTKGACEVFFPDKADMAAE